MGGSGKQATVSSTSRPVLEVSDLSYFFGKKQALKQVNLQVSAGEFCVLLGANGAGKSTIFSLITRLYNSRAGVIRVCGHNLRKRPYSALKKMGAVFQQRSLDADLTVWQNMKYAAALCGFSTRRATPLIEQELQRMGMESQLHDPLRSLSGGQVRRVEIARALMHKPALLVLDEPTVGLDVKSRESIIEHVRNLRRGGTGILWTTHLLDEIDRQDTILVLRRGEIAVRGIAEDIANTKNFSMFKENLANLL